MKNKVAIMCSHCEVMSAVIHVTDPETGEELGICQDCLDAYKKIKEEESNGR